MNAHREKTLKALIKKEAEVEKPVSQWWAYLASLGEEVSSKIFFRSFKRKHASPDLSSMYVTEDWDAPDAFPKKVTGSGGVVREAMKYYSWLFEEKPSDPEAREMMLRHVRKRQISKKSRDRLEKQVRDGEVRSAIRNMACGKAPGPDGLPAEFYKEFEDLVVTDMLRMFDEARKTGE